MWRIITPYAKGDIPGSGAFATPSDTVLQLSEILIQNHDVQSFAELIEKVRDGARRERFFRMDVRPPFADTPDNWELVLEGAFCSVQPNLR